MREPCKLFGMIPRHIIDNLFDNSNASAELDYGFLCFEDVYMRALEVTTPETTIIDLGCAYATQSWFFKDYKKYIGVDNDGNDKTVIHTDNAEFYFMDIQTFIREVLPTLDLDLDNTFAICSYVPDEEARRMVADTFPNCLVYYPGKTDVMKQERR